MLWERCESWARLSHTILGFSHGYPWVHIGIPIEIVGEGGVSAKKFDAEFGWSSIGVSWALAGRAVLWFSCEHMGSHVKLHTRSYPITYGFTLHRITVKVGKNCEW
jgi:hypothetical protein